MRPRGAQDEPKLAKMDQDEAKMGQDTAKMGQDYRKMAVRVANGRFLGGSMKKNRFKIDSRSRQDGFKRASFWTRLKTPKISLWTVCPDRKYRRKPWTRLFASEGPMRADFFRHPKQFQA